MSTTRHAKTRWEGSLMEGAGQVTLDSSGIGTYDVSWPARAEEPNGKTSPEELIAAAHSACFSMALSHALAGAEAAEGAKAGCPVSQALSAVPISLTASLG
jgi:osmotically inducible protein OsmC